MSTAQFIAFYDSLYLDITSPISNKNIRECITFHPSYNNTLTIDTVHPISSQTTFAVDGSNIIIKGKEGLTLIAKNDIEQKNFAHALGQVILSLQTDGIKVRTKF